MNKKEFIIQKAASFKEYLRKEVSPKCVTKDGVEEYISTLDNTVNSTVSLYLAISTFRRYLNEGLLDQYLDTKASDFGFNGEKESLTNIKIHISRFVHMLVEVYDQ